MNLLEVPEFAASNTGRANNFCAHGLSFVLFCAIAASSYGQQQTGSDDSPATDTELRRELVAMGREDKAVRIGMLQALKKQGITFGDGSQLKDPKLQQIFEAEGKKLKLADDRNRRRLSEIIDKHGWPGKTLVGRDGVGAAWLIVQHADSDVKFQKRCLKLLEAAPASEVELKHIAYLTDRVLVNEGKPQRYGTQMGEDFEPRPIEDPENVDKRRAQIGLPPLAEYVQSAKEVYEKMASGAVDASESDR